MRGKGIRLDKYLFQKSLSGSREKAKREILSGWVKVNGETIRQPSRIIKDGDVVQVANPRGTFVSRGGEKLNHALDFFNITLRDAIAADLGSSTGGFTDCLLRRGAQCVYAIDVGYGQLDYRLRNDPRVIVLERKNVRSLEPSLFDRKVTFITADLSFISILKVFKTIKNVFSPAEGIILLKPQFEAKSGEHKKGVVRDQKNHILILNRVLGTLMREGMHYGGITFSPLRGPAGNIEFLLHFNIDDASSCEIPHFLENEVFTVVNAAHSFFTGRTVLNP
jgi:23S rRNA (cytidine1920-2'-O)/16S rRNA (cytidine1409-2'-O)-methyltransferase